ncbi:MAG: peptidoglycan-associated lipoprotein Pal [Pseudomonadota bacterium]
MTPSFSTILARVPRMALLVSALALSACANADRFGGAGAAAGGLGTGAEVTASPNSPAFFRENVGDRVLFPVDQHTLTDVGRNTLAAQARWLAENREFSAIIEGHADEQGTRDYNLALGSRRANSVQEFLLSQGVAGTRLRTVSYGKERPLAVCSEESCYQQNRRAVTVLQAGVGVGS